MNKISVYFFEWFLWNLLLLLWNLKNDLNVSKILQICLILSYHRGCWVRINICTNKKIVKAVKSALIFFLILPMFHLNNNNTDTFCSKAWTTWWASRSRYVITFSMFLFFSWKTTQWARKAFKNRNHEGRRRKLFFNNHKERESEPLHHLTLVHDNEKVIFRP